MRHQSSSGLIPLHLSRSSLTNLTTGETATGLPHTVVEKAVSFMCLLIIVGVERSGAMGGWLAWVCGHLPIPILHLQPPTTLRPCNPLSYPLKPRHKILLYALIFGQNNGLTDIIGHEIAVPVLAF